MKYLNLVDKLLIQSKKSDSILLTTEKDYFRINDDYKKNIKYMKIKIEIEDKENFINLIKNKLWKHLDIYLSI